MKFEMTMRENLILMGTVRSYRIRTAKNQRIERASSTALSKDLFWAKRNRMGRNLYRRLKVAL